MKSDKKNALIRDIIEMIDENENVEVKLSFYSDAFVHRCLNKAYSLWENADKKGLPLEYLDYKEIEELYMRASYYYEHPIKFSYSEMIEGIKIEERKIAKEGLGGKFSRVIKRMFFSSD
ncbi:MAG TPA: hypothetical protein VKU94_01465 [Geobacterales bacterium]|nr:hypothetical protein [Geobacterales bacterium]